MLYGPPGTGKTSLIKAIATKYKSSICILSLRNISDSQFRNALAQVDSRDIVVIEDIDAFAISHSRVNKKVKNPGSDDDDIALTLSGLINAIDGLASGEGRILIATANHPELLDSALTRPGRFDLKVEIGYMTNESMK
jgi:ATP-dependent 26S proteasome regulatory subunit